MQDHRPPSTPRPPDACTTGHWHGPAAYGSAAGQSVAGYAVSVLALLVVVAACLAFPDTVVALVQLVVWSLGQVL